MRKLTTLCLYSDLLERLGEMTPDEPNSLVNEALAERVAAREQEAIRRALIEGYQEAESQRHEIQRDWGAIDLEGWPE